MEDTNYHHISNIRYPLYDISRYVSKSFTLQEILIYCKFEGYVINK